MLIPQVIIVTGTCQIMALHRFITSNASWLVDPPPISHITPIACLFRLSLFLYHLSP